MGQVTLRRVLLLVLVSAVFGASLGAIAAAICSGGACGASAQKGPDLPSLGSPPQQPVPDTKARREVEALFDGYYAALVRDDFAAACDRLAPVTRERFVRNLRRAGRRVASCPRGLGARDARGRPLLNRLAPVFRRAEVVRIGIQGDRASIQWRTTRRGRRLRLEQSARKIKGEWKLTEILSSR